MSIIHISSGKSHEATIELIDNMDFKRITKKRYFFNWQEERAHEIYKLRLKDERDILGLISIERIPEEWRIHIRLLSVSKENRGHKKEFENITGNLLAFVSIIALREYGELACVSLKPKGLIARHYIDKYDMNITGASLSLELPEILNLIKKYDND